VIVKVREKDTVRDGNNNISSTNNSNNNNNSNKSTQTTLNSFVIYTSRFQRL